MHPSDPLYFPYHASCLSFTQTVLARLQSQGANTNSLILDADEGVPLPRARTESRDSFDSSQGSSKANSAALRSQLADIKVCGARVVRVFVNVVR